MTEEIVQIKADKKKYMKLLLIGDPHEMVVNEYLDKCDLHILFSGGKPVSAAAVLPHVDGMCELRNLSTPKKDLGKGYREKLVKHLMVVYGARYRTMMVGTNNPMFYEKLGFRYAFTRKNYYPKTYSKPIYENGSLCVDMICLTAPLQ